MERQQESPQPDKTLGAISEEEQERRRLAAEKIARAYVRKNPKVAPRPVPKESRAESGMPVIPWWATAGSVALFVVLETLAYGWQIAVGIATVIFIHECGHIAAVRKLNLPVIGIVLIPFIGGIAFGGRRGKTAAEDAYIGILGPLYGLATGLACLALYPLTGNPFFLSLTGMIFGIHLFNMLPIPPLDGSHVLPLFHKPKHYDPYYSRVTAAQKTRFIALYIGVAIFAGLGAYFVTIPRP